MWKDLLRLLAPGSARSATIPPAPPLPSVAREAVEHLWQHPDTPLPCIDWPQAERWIAQQRTGENTPQDTDAPQPHNQPHNQPHPWHRAIMAASLDALRDTLTQPHRRWQSLHIEGLAPHTTTTNNTNNLTSHTANLAERTIAALHRELAPIRADHPTTNPPIPPVAILLIEPYEALIDFTAPFHPDEGEFATFGGLYINRHQSTIPIIAINAQLRHNCDAAIVHELTHHALADRNLPLWIEEGITQMMEERHANEWRFTLTHEIVARQHAHWDDAALDAFLIGHAFSSPENDTQELAYHLAQWIVRTMLEHDPKAFFAFARACQTTDPDQACQSTLGLTQRALITQATGITA